MGLIDDEAADRFRICGAEHVIEPRHAPGRSGSRKHNGSPALVRVRVRETEVRESARPADGTTAVTAAAVTAVELGTPFALPAQKRRRLQQPLSALRLLLPMM